MSDNSVHLDDLSEEELKEIRADNKRRDEEKEEIAKSMAKNWTGDPEDLQIEIAFQQQVIDEGRTVILLD